MLRGDTTNIIAKDGVQAPTLVAGTLQTRDITYLDQTTCPVPLQAVLTWEQSSADVLNMVHQTDFDSGTYRITSPGVYRLAEDIVFHPNPLDDYRPRPDQSAMYPPSKYNLGFFAAITIETTGVLLDLNGKTIKQSVEHYLQQRFFAVIELADQPFIVGQGPAAFGPSINAASNTKIMNGTLGLSAHHGIHGNNNSNIAIVNLEVMHFEIAGIALNGGTDIAMYDVNVHDSLTQVPVLATYSHARFLLPFLNMVSLNTPIVLKGVSQTGTQIKDALLAEMQTTFNEWVAGGTVSSTLFANPAHVADGAVYGILFNQRGVAVNDFLAARVGGNGNEGIILKNVGVFNLRTNPHEVIALSSPVLSTGYKKVQTGPVGDVFRAQELADGGGLYVRNTLADAQLFLSTSFGNISASTRAWAASTSQTLTEAMAIDNSYFVGGGDSMAHTGKGAIGLFLSGAKNVYADNVDIQSLHNIGARSTYDGTDYTYRNANVSGIVVAASENIEFRNSSVIDVRSTNAQAFGVQFVNATSVIYPGLKVRNVTGGLEPIVNNGNNPNPLPTGKWRN